MTFLARSTAQPTAPAGLDPGTYPDVEKVLADLLAPLVGGLDHIDSEAPSDLEQRLPFIQIVRYGGPDDGITDQAAIDVDCYGATRSDAITLAQHVHQLLTGGSRLGGHGIPLLDLVTTSVGVVERPRPGSNVRRFGGSYTVSARRIRA